MASKKLPLINTINTTQNTRRIINEPYSKKNKSRARELGVTEEYSKDHSLCKKVSQVNIVQDVFMQFIMKNRRIYKRWCNFSVT